MTGEADEAEAARGPDVHSVTGRLAKCFVGPEGTDARLVVAIGLCFAALYGALAWRLSLGHFFEHYNLVFDYDSPAYVDLFSPKPGDVSHMDNIGRAIKHPLSPWLSLFTLPFRLFGVDRCNAAGFASACVGGATVALFFAFARTAGTLRLEAFLVTLIFGLGAAHLFPSMLVESYAYAALSLGAVWYLTAQRIFRHRRLRVAAAVSGVMAFGVTVTNIAQAAIAELFAQWSQRPFRRTFRNTLLAGLAVAALSAIAVAATWPHAISYTLAHPGQAAREILWQQTKGPTTGPGPVIVTFFGLSLAAPQFTTIPLPEGILMRDFRHLDMPALAIAGILLWNLLLLIGAFVAVRTERTRMMALALLSAIFFNVVLNMRVQFRGSLFIYTPHLWFAIAALVAVGAAAWQPSSERHRWYFRAALVAILVAVAPSNLVRAFETAKLFDNPKVFTIPANVR